MEKLKPKHDHKLTDIIKVAIFGLMLLLPFISWMPNAFYYGFNEHAVVGQEEQYYNFYQGVKNGKPINVNTDSVNDWNFVTYDTSTEFNINNGFLFFDYFRDFDLYISTSFNTNINTNDILFFTITFDVAEDFTLDDYNIDFLNEDDNYFYEYDFQMSSNTNYISFIFDSEITNNLTLIDIYGGNTDYSWTLGIKNVQLFNLTEIFGSGNEPTKEEFENMLTQEYYNYGDNYVLKDRGTNITWSMYNSWEDVWQTPLFSWTNNSILKTGLNAFCGAFGIVDSSYITNLLVYELVIVAIYIVLDIVITLFKWLTHIGQKE